MQATDRKSLDDWRDVFATAFEMSMSAGQAWVEATLHAGGANAPRQLSVGYLDDKPVATSILFKGVGVAGIYGVGMLPELRREGFGAAITVKPLRDACQQGYPVYQRLGFREVKNRIGIYIWEKEQP